MNTLFLLLSLASLACLIVGLTKPATFFRFVKGKSARKNIGLVFGIATLVFLALFSLTTEAKPTNSSSDTPQTSQPVKTPDKTSTETVISKKYEKLTLDAQRVGDSITVDGETDLPNDSKLTIQVERPSLWKGETEKRYSKAGWNNPIVKDGKYSANITIDDSGVLNEAESVDSNVRITVSFHPNWYGEKLQTDDVLKLVGTRGENLSGQLIKTIGELTDKPYKILETKTTVDFPFKLIK